jgi:hypothetical protein
MDTCYCKCGGVWRSNTKLDMKELNCIAEIRCPNCLKCDNLRRVSSEPEYFEVTSRILKGTEGMTGGVSLKQFKHIKEIK